MDFLKNETVYQKLFYVTNEEAEQNHWRQEDLAAGDTAGAVLAKVDWERRPAIGMSHIKTDTASRKKGTE